MVAEKRFIGATLAALLLATVGGAGAATDGYVFRYRMNATLGNTGGPGGTGGSGGTTTPGGGTTNPGTGTGTPGGGGTTDPGTGGSGQGDRFIPLAAPPAIVADEGGKVDVVVGTYEGDGAQWKCAPVNGADWLTCQFEDTAVHAVGYAPAATTFTTQIVVQRTGYTNSVSVPVEVRPVEPTYVASAVPNRYVQSGTATMIELGGYTGLADGWTCSARNASIPSWISCLFKEGKVYATGTAPTNRTYDTLSVNVSKNGQLEGYTSLFYVSRGPRGYTDAHDDARPRAGAATFAAKRNLYAVSGKPFEFKMGTYTGGDGGWTCYSDAGELPPWIDCNFRNGEITVSGTAPSRTYSFANIAAVRDGVVLKVNELFYLSTDGRDYQHGAATTLTPRTGSVSLLTLPDFYVPKGEAFRFKIGTYTGGDGGWTCYGSAAAMNSWQSCDFKDGEIFVFGTGPGRVYDYANIAVVRDGVELGTTNLFSIRSDVQGYAQGAATPLTPRGGSASVTASNIYFPQGTAFRFKIGTYSGGDGGWTCFGNAAAMPSWQSCEFTDGNVYLKGTAPGRSSSYTNYSMVRDGRLISTTNLMTIDTDTQTYAVGDAPSDTPRGGSVTWSVPLAARNDGRGGSRQKIGTYTGGEGGWTCYGSANYLPAFASCEFKDGDIFLVGAPGGSGYQYLNLTAVRDSVQIRTSNLFTIN